MNTDTSEPPSFSSSTDVETPSSSGITALPPFDIGALIEREGCGSSGHSRSIASSPSGSSMISDVDLDSSTRPSPFAPMLASDPTSPSIFGVAGPAMGGGGGGGSQNGLPAMIGSGSSSRSSSDNAYAIREAINERMNRPYRERKRERNSSDSSNSDEDGSEAASQSGGGVADVDAVSEDGIGSRKCSVETPIRQADMPRGRLANIRRESSCTPGDEAAHERMMTATQQVSSGWDDALRIAERSDYEGARSPGAFSNSSTGGGGPRESFTLGASVSEESILPRKRAPSASLSEPISILTNAFLPHSCSPSPTRMSESTKQCYSPSTQKIVRPNIPYSPSPSPTASPTRKRLMSARSQSPIASRGALKRRCDGLAPVNIGSPVASVGSPSSSGMAAIGGGAVGGIGERLGPSEAKRSCPAAPSSAYVRSSTSPLVCTESRPFSYASPSSTSIAGASTSGCSMTCPSPSHSSAMLESPAALSFYPKRPSPFLVESDFRRASYSVDSYSDVDARSNRGEDCDSLSEPNSVLMPVEESDQFASLSSPSHPDSYLFRAPSVPPPLSVESAYSLKEELTGRDVAIPGGSCQREDGAEYKEPVTPGTPYSSISVTPSSTPFHGDEAAVGGPQDDLGEDMDSSLDATFEESSQSVIETTQDEPLDESMAIGETPIDVSNM